MNIMHFDIETVGGHFEASYGRVLCVSYMMDHWKSPKTIHARTLQEEQEDALPKLKELWDDVDILTSWNGKMFDFKFIQSRIFQATRQPIDKKKHVDLYHIAKANLKFRGFRLDGFAKDMTMEHQKYEVPARDWVKAMESETYPQAYKEIVKHCEQDVRMTREAFHILKPFIIRIHK